MMKKKRKKIVYAAAVFALGVTAVCLKPQTVVTASEQGRLETISSELVYEDTMELSYADQFQVDYYEGGYAQISIVDGDQFLVVPDGAEVPKDLDEQITVLQQPIQNIYLVATSAMDFFRAINGIDHIRLSGTDIDGWYIEEAKEALKNGKMVYAGKYSAPDYELILSEKCGLAIESTMIYHTPEVKENLESFGIPVLVERSSYESHPLGRMEWIKLYGLLLGKEDVAEKIFEEQKKMTENILGQQTTGTSDAFFYLSTVGYANVRKSDDYIAKMIELAGGNYIFEDLGDSENALSTMNMQMEEFYARAKDADYIIYNSTIDGELQTIDELLEKSALLKDFKAVKEGNVWCTEKNLFQETTGLGQMIADIHQMLTSEDDDLKELSYMHRLQ